MKELEKKALDCVKNHSHTLVRNATESDIEKREMELYIEGYKQSKREMQKENEQLKAQIEKMKCCGNCKYKKGGVVETCRKKKIYTLNKGCCEEWESAE